MFVPKLETEKLLQKEKTEERKQAEMASKKMSVVEFEENDSDEVVNNDQIDFAEMQSQFIDRTQTTMPYVLHRIEDVMFIDDKHLVALEYVFYQKDGDYRKIAPSKGPIEVNLLKTDCYKVDKLPEKSAFRNKPVALQCEPGDYLQQHRREAANSQSPLKKKLTKLMEPRDGRNELLQSFKMAASLEIQKQKRYFMETPEDEAMCEGILSLWKITSQG